MVAVSYTHLDVYKRQLPLVDQVIELDERNRKIKKEVESLRAEKNRLSKLIGGLMKDGKREEAENTKAQVAAGNARIDELTAEEKKLAEEIKNIMMVIPNIIDSSVPVSYTHLDVYKRQD